MGMTDNDGLTAKCEVVGSKLLDMGKDDSLMVGRLKEYETRAEKYSGDTIQADFVDFEEFVNLETMVTKDRAEYEALKEIFDELGCKSETHMTSVIDMQSMTRGDKQEMIVNLDDL